MFRSQVVLAAVALLASVAIPSAVHASSNSYGSDSDGERFAWAIVSGGNCSMFDLDDVDSFDKLKEEYGNEFLYIHQGDRRYVIRDRELMERARLALKPVTEAGREIGEAARIQVEQALGDSQDGREQRRLARGINRLEREIDRMERQGKDTEDLERDMIVSSASSTTSRRGRTNTRSRSTRRRSARIGRMRHPST